MTDLKSVPLAFKHRQRLVKMGYFHVEHVIEVSEDDLRQDLLLHGEQSGEARLLQLECRRHLDRQRLGMFQLLADMKSEYVETGFASLDQMLGGGLPVGKCIELYGEAGSGCTQLCMQTCANLVVTDSAAKCLYVDTEGSFMAERMAQLIYCRLVENMQSCGDFNVDDNDNIDTDKMAMKMEQCMSRIICIRIADDLEFMRLLQEVEETVCSGHNGAVKLMIIDSIAQPFRFSFNNWNERTFHLSFISQRLLQLANEYNMTVMLTNQITTKFPRIKSSDQTNTDDDGNFKKDDAESQIEGYLAPCLGESWTYAATIRCFISRTGFDRSIRTCRVVKIPYPIDRKVIKFTITVLFYLFVISLNMIS